MKNMLPVLILAGGLATRLRPITETIPKSLVDVAGEPFVCRQLKYLKSQGIDTVVMCIGYLGEMIREVIEDGRKFGLKVLYVPDGPQLLGTGGAVKNAVMTYSSELEGGFFVLYGDSYLPIDFEPVQRLFEGSNAPALMTVMRNQNQWDKSNVFFENKVLSEYNKTLPSPEMAHIDYGLSILCPSVLSKYKPGEIFDLATVFHELSISGQLKGYEVFHRFFEIGSHIGLGEAEEYFLIKDRQ